MQQSTMSRAATIAEWPLPPKRRLAFPWLILKMIGNPVASWSEDFYDEPVVFNAALSTRPRPDAEDDRSRHAWWC